MLHFGGLHISVVTVGELMTWARRRNAPASRLQGVRDLIAASGVHDIDLTVADKFGEVRAALVDRGITVGEIPVGDASRHVACCARATSLKDLWVRLLDWLRFE